MKKDQELRLINGLNTLTQTPSSRKHRVRIKQARTEFVTQLNKGQSVDDALKAVFKTACGNNTSKYENALAAASVSK